MNEQNNQGTPTPAGDPFHETPKETVPAGDPFHYNPADAAQTPTAQNTFTPQPAQNTAFTPEPAQSTPFTPEPAQSTPFTPPPFGTQPAYMQEYPTGLATASMVIGIISIVIFFGFYSFPPLLLLPIIGIILGCVYKSKRYPVGRGSSTAGIVCSVISLVLFIAVLILAVANIQYLLELIKDYDPAAYEQYRTALEQAGYTFQ